MMAMVFGVTLRGLRPRCGMCRSVGRVKPATVAVFLGLALAGCADQPAPREPLAAPAQWRFASDSQAVAQDARWWQRFGSAELDELVGRAQQDSFDLQAGSARLRQAQAALRIAGAARVPELDGTFDASRQGRLGGEADVDGNYFALGLNARYELDLWGRNRALRDAARADWRASRFDLDTLRLSLSAAVASSWLRSAGLRERLEIARLNLANAEQVLGTVESRYRAGAATPLELAQQRGLVAEQRRERAELQQQVGDSDTALAVLLGTPAQGLTLRTQSLQDVDWPRAAAGLPSELLARRPDVARAEAQLSAADADLAAARAALFPGVTLGAGIGAGSERSARLFDSPLYTLGSGLVAPIFNGGRLSAQRDRAAARQAEMLADYRGALIAAFADVDAALNAIAGLDARLQAQDEQLRQARLAFELAESRYRAGAETLLTLLDAQRSLYAAQDTQVQLRQARLQASVTLYKALGGGWQRG